MVQCKYFREGFCMFGSRCRFEHVQGGHDFRYANSYNNESNRQSGG